MSQCEYYYKYANGESKQCDEDSLPGDYKCIFHSLNENKDADDFKEAFNEKIGVTELDFTGYVFPVEVKNEIFPKEAKEEGSDSSKIVIFNKKMIFKQASFLKGIIFSNLIFEESIDMSECQFHEECYFNGSEFKGEVILDESIVRDKLSFDKSKFYATLSWENDPSAVKASEGEVFFANIKVLNTDQISFSRVDLSRWSFMGSDVSKMNIKFCKWADGKRIKSCHGRSKSTSILYDELVRQWDYKPFRSKCLHPNKVNSKNNKEYDEILYLYRGLRMNYESKLQYKEAGAFHIGEMEARRLALIHNNKRKIMPFFEYFFMWLYKFLSDYGENYLKALSRFSFVVIAFALLFMFAGLQTNSDNKNLTSKGYNLSEENIDYVLSIQAPSDEDIKALLSDFGRSMVYSFSVATIFLKDKQYTYKNGWSYYLFVLESCFGAIILPLLVLAVRRNFKRSTKEKFYG